MKKIISALLLVFMLASLLTVAVNAADDVKPVCPDWLITEIGCDNGTTVNEDVKPYVKNEKYMGSNSEPYEFIELTNTSGKELNIFDYALFMNWCDPTSSNWETFIFRTEPIKPDDTWVDWDWGDPLVYWDGTPTMPQNPSYAGGVVEPGEVIILWMFCEGHRFGAQFEDFKEFWRIPGETKVFLVDSNSKTDTSLTTKSYNGETVPYGGAEKNFNMANSACCSYGIMKWDDAAKAKFNDACNVKGGKGVNFMKTSGDTYVTTPDIDSWAVLYYNFEITDFVENQCQTFSFIYSPTSALYTDAGGKRAEYYCTNDFLDSTVGWLTDDQKASLPDPNDPIFNPVTPGGDDTTPASGDDTTPAPGDDTTPAPGNDTTPAPVGDTTPAPGGNDTTKADDKKDDDKKGCKSSFACGIALVAVFGSAVVLGKKH